MAPTSQRSKVSHQATRYIPSSRLSSIMMQFQCGYCTPGQICSAAGLIAEGKAKTDDDPRINERKYLPLRRLPKYSWCDQAGHEHHGRAVVINSQYSRAQDVADAVRLVATDPGAKFIAGGTNLVDLMKDDVERPSLLVDVSRLPLNKIDETADGGITMAPSPNSDLAYHPAIQSRYPILSSAVLAGASQQLRNMASTGGSLLQRTHFAYFTIRRHLAANVSLAAVAPPSTASIEATQSSARARLHRHASVRHVRCTDCA